MLHFVLTKNAGSSKPGMLYQMKHTDLFSNICTWYVDHLHVVSNFFAGSNVVDTHNQLHQDSLKLEKKWITQNPWFRLATILIGVTVKDAFLLCNYHKVINTGLGENQEKKITIRSAGILANQLMGMANKLEAGNNSSKFVPEDDPIFMVSVPQQSSDFSSPKLTSSFPITFVKNVIRFATDTNRLLHYQVKYDVTKDLSS